MKVSIIIVCMNNMKNIYPCLRSIRKYTTIEYETLLVAYKFSKGNLEILKRDFPWVNFIESNEIRGFSENNNLALRQAKGDFCFVLNDDTYFDTPVVDQLYHAMIESPDISIMSPHLYYPDGKEQFFGRPKLNARKFILSTLKLWGESNMRDFYRNSSGIYDIFNISGAAFMIKTSVFEELGWFDETYFFSPEDIALSTLAQKRGHRICQNSQVHITHIASGTSSPISAATLPASFKGHLLFYSNNSVFKYYLLCLIEYPIVFAKYLAYSFLSLVKKDLKYKIYSESEYNTFISMGNKKLPKELFVKYYNQLMNRKND